MPNELLNRAKQRLASLRSALPSAPAAAGTDGAGEPTAELRLAATRRRLRRLKARVAELEQANADLKAEIARTRSSVRDPLIDLALPEGVEAVADAVIGEHLTFLRRADLLVLARQVHQVDRLGAQGLIIETGAARGGSAIVMAAAKDPARPMKVYDVFGMIPEPSERDGEDVHRRFQKIASGQAKGRGGETYYGYRDDLYAEVTESFARHGVEAATHGVDLVQGLFEDTIHLDEPVAFAHLDGDWYDSTMTCLERIAPRLIPGGRIVLDDYFHYSGCRQAVDDYFAGRAGYRLERRAKIHVVRTVAD